MAQTAVRCVVSGRVQGVFYRAATADRAHALNLDGWVRNRQDGSVELVAKGAPEAVESLVAWLWQGPASASVSEVTLEEFDGDVERGFHVAR